MGGRVIWSRSAGCRRIKRALVCRPHGPGETLQELTKEEHRELGIYLDTAYTSRITDHRTESTSIKDRVVLTKCLACLCFFSPL